MTGRVLFYSSVRDKELFHIQRFYTTDISILEQLGYKIILSNRISDAWKFWKYDIVFAYFYRYAFFPAIIAKIFGKNTYFTGGIDALDKDLVTKRDYNIQKWFFKLCYWVSKSCIIVSRTDDANVRQLVKGRKLSYSEHTIETEPFRCELSQKKNIFVTIGWQATVGNVQRKGMDTSIRLFAELHKLPEYEEAKLFILGKTGEGTNYLRKIVRELGVEDSVEFTGSVSEEQKVDYLRRSKYYFQMSLFEGFGVAALEALCAKNIVIHSGKGGLSNPIYNDGVTVSIDQPFEEMYADLKNKLLSFNDSCLEQAYENVCQQYDNVRRKADFAKIING